MQKLTCHEGMWAARTPTRPPNGVDTLGKARVPGVACLAHLIGFPDIRSGYAFAIALKPEIKPPVLWLVDAMPSATACAATPQAAASRPLDYDTDTWWQHEAGVTGFQNEVIEYLYYKVKYGKRLLERAARGRQSLRDRSPSRPPPARFSVGSKIVVTFALCLWDHRFDAVVLVLGSKASRDGGPGRSVRLDSSSAMKRYRMATRL
jgi:hypothetical protein